MRAWFLILQTSCFQIKQTNHTISESFKSEKSGGKAYKGALQDFKVGSGADMEANPENIMAEARKCSANTPSIGMDGEADPSQISGFKTEAAQSIQNVKKSELSQINSELHENHIMPEPDDTIIKAQKSARAVTTFSVTMEHMKAIPPKVAAQMNPSLALILKTQQEGIKSKKAIINAYDRAKIFFCHVQTMRQPQNTPTLHIIPKNHS